VSKIESAQSRASAWIMSSPVRAWTVTLLALFLMTAAVPAALIDEADSRGYQASLFVLFWMVVLAGFPLVFPSLARRRPSEIIALLCALCLAPTMLALWAASRGAGRWLPLTGWVLSTWMVEVVLRRAVQEAKQVRPEASPEG
jgi:hypothetical protein